MAKTHRTSDLSALTLTELTKQLDGRHSAPLAHNTRVECDDDGSIGVRFHATRILTFHPDGSFTVNTNGYRTVTTKQRLNALLPAGYRIHSERYAWKITTPEGVFDFSDGDRWGVTDSLPSEAPRFSCRFPHASFAWCGPFCENSAPDGSFETKAERDARLSGPHFHAGHNDAGYLPESDVETFDTFSGAAGYLADDMRRSADDLETWADEHDCDDIPCPTYGDECAWQLAGSLRIEADELAEATEAQYPNGFQTYASDGRSLPVSWWISPCSEAECAEVA